MKKVLIISYYWPPAAGITVHRTLKLSKYLRNFGWEPIVFAPANPDYPGIDHSNDKDLQSELTIIKGKIWEPYAIYRKITGQAPDTNVNNVFYTNDEKTGLAHKLSVWIRSNFFIPDARCMWIKPSVKLLLDYIENNKIDAIFSDGPPHTNTRIGCIIKQKTNIPWLADFQDPWTQVDYYSLLKLTRFADKKHKRLEQEVFKNADKITIVSKSWKNDIESIGAREVSVIPWGFDPDDYKGLKKYNGQKFSFAHIGILGYDRNPKEFLKAFADMCNSNPDFKENSVIQLAGQVDHSVVELIKEYEIIENVNLLGFVTREKALDIISSSCILLLLLNQQKNAKGRIPGKLFEYLAVRRPILCLGDTKGDTAEIISNAQAGQSFEYEDYINTKKYLEEVWRKFENNIINDRVNSDIDSYSNLETTKVFATYLDDIVNRTNNLAKD